jgi:hypothetical protein
MRPMQEQTERQIAHLAMIQAVISRMASSSFTLKTLAVTLSAGIIALVGSVQKPSPLYAIAAMVAVAVFAWMDSRYLRLESLYRALYEDVRFGREVSAFDMNVDRYLTTVKSLPRVALSWSINAIYSVLFVVLLIVAIGIWRAS